MHIINTDLSDKKIYSSNFSIRKTLCNVKKSMRKNSFHQNPCIYSIFRKIRINEIYPRIDNLNFIVYCPY